MLILTRKQGEKINIGNDIRISILDIRGRNVRIGVEAPKSMVILREELYLKILQQNQKAAEESKKTNLHTIVKLLSAKNGTSEKNEVAQ